MSVSPKCTLHRAFFSLYFVVSQLILNLKKNWRFGSDTSCRVFFGPKYKFDFFRISLAILCKTYHLNKIWANCVIFGPKCPFYTFSGNCRLIWAKKINSELTILPPFRKNFGPNSIRVIFWIFGWKWGLFRNFFRVCSRGCHFSFITNSMVIVNHWFFYLIF